MDDISDVERANVEAVEAQMREWTRRYVALCAAGYVVMETGEVAVEQDPEDPAKFNVTMPVRVRWRT